MIPNVDVSVRINGQWVFTSSCAQSKDKAYQGAYLTMQAKGKIPLW